MKETEMFDNKRLEAHIDGKYDVASDPYRSRLREYVLSKMEDGNETGFSNWKNLTLDARMSSLQRLADVEAKIHNRKSPNVKIMSDAQEQAHPNDKGFTTKGIDDDNHKYCKEIFLRREFVENDSPKTSVEIICHESKHADQVSEVYKKGSIEKSREQVIKNELFLTTDEYEEQYSDLLIENEAFAAGKRGVAVLEKVLDADDKLDANDLDETIDSFAFEEYIEAQKSNIIDNAEENSEFYNTVNNIANRMSPEEIKGAIDELGDPNEKVTALKDAIFGNHPERTPKERMEVIKKAYEDWGDDVLARTIYSKALDRAER
ncbi:MAG: hypothetical protein IJU44_07345 [Kiritimatiellae bacterium]|nr:hypothetical protein [Kiritimatiellia bacterium]